MKRCTKCGREKDDSLFRAEKRNRSGLASWCKECHNKGVSCAKKRNPEKYREYDLRRNYGIDLRQYQFLFVRQNGNCAICGVNQSKLKKRLEVDHDHVTGKVRGLLCGDCNKTLGKLKDNISTVRRMLSYLQKNKGVAL